MRWRAQRGDRVAPAGGHPTAAGLALDNHGDILVDDQLRTSIDGGDEVVHANLETMYTKRPYTAIQRAVHHHPTVTELIPTMLEGLKPASGSS